MKGVRACHGPYSHDAAQHRGVQLQRGEAQTALDGFREARALERPGFVAGHPGFGSRITLPNTIPSCHVDVWFSQSSRPEALRSVDGSRSCDLRRGIFRALAKADPASAQAQRDLEFVEDRLRALRGR